MQSQGAARSVRIEMGVCVEGGFLAVSGLEKVRMTSLLQGERPELRSGYCPRIHFPSHGFCASARDLWAAHKI